MPDHHTEPRRHPAPPAQAATGAPDGRLHRQSGDGWVQCGCGQKHWGLNGAAGLLLWRAPDGQVPDLVLQHRALWSHHGGTWGLPGGALADGESPVSGAVREAVEEAGVPSEELRVHATRVLDHPDWAYTTVVAEARTAFTPSATDQESLEVGWVSLAELDDRPLLPAFADALPELRTMLRRLVLVVDAANVVGSRPDGWWKDRRAAAVRLRDRLAALRHQGLSGATVDLPGSRWFPEVVMVVEGAARGTGSSADVTVVAAPRSGDDEIVAQVRRAVDDHHAAVLVATADRELIGRVRALGAGVIGPRTLLR